MKNDARSSAVNASGQVKSGSAASPRRGGRDEVTARRERADEHAADGPGGARVERLQHEGEDQADRPGEVDEPGHVAAGQDRLRLGQVTAM